MSDTDQSTVEISLLGKKYTFRCGEGEAEGLERAARYLDSALAGVKQHTGVLGDDKVVLMTALNITHELQREIERRHALEKEVEQLTRRIDSALSAFPPHRDA